MEKNILNKVTAASVTVCAIGLPLIVFTSTLNAFTTPKMFLTITSAITLILTYGLSGIISKKLHTASHSYIYSLTLFLIVVLLNLVVNREGIFDAIMGRGLMYLSIGVIALSVAGSAAGKSRMREMLPTLTVIATTTLALHSIAQLMFLYKVAGLPAIMHTRSFTLTGNPITTLTMLVIGGSTAYYLGLKSVKRTVKTLYLGSGIVTTIAAVAYVSLLLPGSELAPNVLPYRASWSIALDTLKSTRSMLVGIGLANFSSLYTAIKPLYLNGTAFWNVLPASASSELLNILITLGIPGLITFTLLPLTVLPSAAAHLKEHGALSINFLISLCALIVTPASLPVLFLFLISGALLIEPTEHTHSPRAATTYLIGVACIITAVVTVYFVGRSYLAELHMFRAQKALANNDGKLVYEESQKGVSLAPLSSGYHLSYSQVNLSLASALSQKESLSDKEREQVATLVSQAIREGKIAGELRPNDVRNWQNLGSIYRNLINVADKADQFAVAAYTQAITVSPADPSLRVEYGGLLYQLAGVTKDEATQKTLLAGAVQQFQTAVQLKPDFANGYYNLSKAYESAGNVTAAYAAMQKAVASLTPDSQDLSQATTELETLKAKLPASPAPSSSPEPSTGKEQELSEPSPLPSPISGGPVPTE